LAARPDQRSGSDRSTPDGARAPAAFARSDYQLAEKGVERRSERASSSLWLGAEDALAQFGVQRGQAIERDDLIAALQGQHVQTGEQLRRPGVLKRDARDEHGQALVDDDGRPVVEKVTGVAHVEMTMSVPKSVSVLWAMADQADRETIEQALIAAAERTVQYMARNKAVVHRRGKDGVRVREPAAGAAVASSLHVTARRARGDGAPAPQLHIHNLVVGVVRIDGRLVAADSWEWFRHDAALEGGALFRAQVADALVNAGWAIRSGTGDRGRYFEVQGVPESLCEVMSPRSREVAEARAEVERELGIRLQGGALAVLAKETRQAKDHDLDPERLREVWDALGQEHAFGPGAGSALLRRDGYGDDVEGRMREAERVVLAGLRDQGPTVSLARARALVFEAAAGRLSADDAVRLLARMERPKGGELLALDDGRITSREIRALEQHVMDVAVCAAGKEDPAGRVGEPDRQAGVAAAEAKLGDGSHLDGERRIPTTELWRIRRHRDPDDPSRVHPWLPDYQVAVDQGRGADAVALLREQDALKLYDTRAQAMGGMVQEWDSWRDRSDPSQSALIVHGPNSDVDLVNELAQRRRLEAGELGEQAVSAVDREYLLRPGDLVAIRNAAYTFPPRPGGPRPKRVENGQIALIDAVDVEKDTMTLLVREPGAQPRLVEIDQTRLRAEHATGKRAAAVRLAYAMHSFPAQGATVHGTATLAGHWSQAKRETYVGDTRAVYRHTVHVAREDLGVDGTDEDRTARYAQRITQNRQRLASIRSALDPTPQLSPKLPAQVPIPSLPSMQPRSTPARASSDSSPGSAARANHDRPYPAATTQPPTAEPTGPPVWLAEQLGPRPEERITRERWEREAERLNALQGGGRSQRTPATQQPAKPPTPPAHPSGSAAPRQQPPRLRGVPTIGR
jgi:conjugative relaxase-like TrwC/TraI family protein